jgi:NAD(P)-dependent dehydrogenase (short-subunit alcohol dehydrogenase family)
MKIIVIGSTGTLGTPVVRALARSHEIIGVSRKSDPSVDIDDHRTIAPLFTRIAQAGKPDAVVCCAGGGAFGKNVLDLNDDDLAYSVRSKLLGQVKVIREALRYVSDGGSITVTTGTLAQTPFPGASAVSMINAGLEGFVRGASLDAPRGIRVNAVSPSFTTEALVAFKMDPSGSMSANDVARAYVAAVEGKDNGQILDPRRYL